MTKIAIAVPWNSPFVWAKTMPSFLNMSIPKDVEVKWFWPNGWCSARRKTGGVEMAQKWGADYIWFLDADQLCEEDTLERLWGHVEVGRCPIGAIQPARGYFKGLVERPYQPVCWNLDGKPYTPEKVETVMYGPLNCILLPMKLFESLERPWFTERFDPITMGRLSSIDQHFTRKIWLAGSPMWVDPGIRPKHLDVIPLDWSFQEKFTTEDFK